MTKEDTDQLVREGLELIKDFRRIQSQKDRKVVMELAKSLAEKPAGNTH
jgi:hypothetical protein